MPHNNKPVTVIDGGMGKELRRIGAPFRQPEWSALALMEAPELVAQAHRNFVEAGAEVITVNSYALVPFHLGEEGYADRGFELAALAAGLAREVADEAERSVLVAGSLPPPFGSYLPDRFEGERAADIWGSMVEAQSGSVDLWIAETMSSVAEVVGVLEALEAERRSAPVWVSVSLNDHLRNGEAVLRSGEGLAEVVEVVAAAQANALLFNCSQPESIAVAVGAVVPLVGDDLRIGGYANAFPADAHAEEGEAANEVVVEQPRADLTPPAYADLVQAWVDDGASIVGGCCDIYPEHIAELVGRFA